MSIVAAQPVAAPVASVPPASPAVLVLACDGYGKGTTGTITGRRQGCLVFEPDASSAVARWASPRRTLLVPPSAVASIR